MKGLLKFFKEASPRVKVVLVFIGVASVGVIGGAGYSINKILSLQIEREHAIEENEAEQAEIATRKTPFAYAVTLKDISIPLVDKSATRVAYAQFTLVLDCGSKEGKRSIELNRAKILDSIFEVASQFYVEDFESTKGLISFKEALKKSYTKTFSNLAPRDLAIENWFLG